MASGGAGPRVNGDGLTGAVSRVWFPIATLVIAAIVSFYTSERLTAIAIKDLETENAVLRSELLALKLWQADMMRWREKTDDSRFTAGDGVSLEMMLKDEIKQHGAISAHGIVGARLTRLETLVEFLTQRFEPSELR